MAVRLAEILLLGLLAAWIFHALHVPGLVGILLVGVLLGPNVTGMMDPAIVAIGNDLRLIALVVILLRAGFELSRTALNRVGLQALLLSVIPAVLEGVAITFLGPPLLGLSLMESAVLGSVLAAVSPAVVVPLMIRTIEERRGTAKGIPTLILAASSLDDVFVIVIYGILIGIHTGTGVDIGRSLVDIPVSIVTGIAVGAALGFLLYRLFDRFNPRATKRVIVIIGLAVLLARLEHTLAPAVPFAGLLAVMTIGFVILEKREHMAHEISARLGKIWIFAELILFAMVGAQVDVQVAMRASLTGGLLIFLGLAARSAGVLLCLLGSDLTLRERLFTAVAYLPKATVQAAIGGAPLAAMSMAGMPTAPGEIILSVAVLSIVLTAPLGAWAISYLAPRLLTQDTSETGDSLEAARESDGDEGYEFS
jgi:solute carrier family 9B (sodium/hydrogen exchanger), member 1/2